MENNNCSFKDLQDAFVCRKCGFCCLHGGQILFTEDDIKRIAAYLGCEPANAARIPVAPYKPLPGFFYLVQTAPCFYFDIENNTCTIHEVKPSRCVAYPFALRATREAGWFDVLMCPAARDMLDEHFDDEELL